MLSRMKMVIALVLAIKMTTTYKEHPERAKKATLRSRRKLRIEVLGHYSGGTPKCSCCGEENIEFLTIDHINGHGNEDRRQKKTGGGTEFWRWLKKHWYPEGFQVLCFNCNIARYWSPDGVCPHKKVKN